MFLNGKAIADEVALHTLFFLYKIVVFLAQAEYSYFLKYIIK